VDGGYTVSDPLAMEYSEKDSVASLVQQALILLETQNLTICMPSALLAQTPHLSRFQLTSMFIITSGGIRAWAQL
jgi:hypothetical protein